MSQSSSPYETTFSEFALDGVRYAQLVTGGGLWRLASLTPAWREELPFLGQNPTSETLKKLSDKHIYIGSGNRPRLAVMCCGLGSAWPGMGRELYDNFPAAREAMDFLASLADWDLLSLMDERDPEILNHSRTQIPYLFMLEYAQWSQLAALGLKPDLVCGHSLGELVALCLAGVYSPGAAWHLFDIRSVHMAKLEESSGNDTGMLAISADRELVDEALDTYPELRISNCNTSRQYILGGPRPQLLELRKNLRKKKIPAFMLGINLAFHNPSMRILRNLSWTRLKGLNMHAPAIPMLSCITADLYPPDQSDICTYIANLDENTVDWPKSVSAMATTHGISHFLELGPQETLSGLVNEIYPAAKCFASSRKGHEAMAMRQLCAQLFAMGFLDEKLMNARTPTTGQIKPIPKPAPVLEAPAHACKSPLTRTSEWKLIVQLLSEETGRPEREIEPNLDLRYDLAVRSSRFPYLVQEAERRLNRQFPLEKLLQISTVGDLAGFVTGERNHDAESPETNVQAPPTERPTPFKMPPLAAYQLTAETPSSLVPWHPDPDVPGILRKFSGPICLCALDATLIPQIWSGLAPFKSRLFIPEGLIPGCEALKESGNQLFPLKIDACSSPEAIIQACRDATAGLHPFQGFLFAPAPLAWGDKGQKFQNQDMLRDILVQLNSICAPDAWFCCIQRLLDGEAGGFDPERTLDQARDFFRHCEPLLSDREGRAHAILWLDQRTNPGLQNSTEAGDMLARELLYASPAELLWLPASLDQTLNQNPVYCPAARCMEHVQCSQDKVQPRLGHFIGEVQFSAYADPLLAQHGASPTGQSQDAVISPWLPMGHILKIVLEASRLTVPWLAPFAISDVHIHEFPLLPPGTVRECRLNATAGQWLLQEKVLSRLCSTTVDIRGLSPNGRRTRNWQPLCDAQCALASMASPLSAYHKLSMANPDFEPVPDTILEKFYEALKFGPQWRYLDNFAQAKPEAGKTRSLYYKAALGQWRRHIAGSSEWEYTNFANISETIYQALLLALALPCGVLAETDSLSESLCKWSFRTLGLARFVDHLEKVSADLTLYFKRSWEDARFVRFDGMVCASSGEPVFSFLNFEFNRPG